MNQQTPRKPPANDPDPVETPQEITPSEAPSPANNPDPVEEPESDPAPDQIAPGREDAPDEIQLS